MELIFERYGLYILAFSILLIVVGILLLFKRTPSRVQMDISLEDLSEIWLPYNRDVQPLSPDSREIEELFHEEGEEENTLPLFDGMLSEEKKTDTSQVVSHNSGISSGPMASFVDECVRPFIRVFETQNAVKLLNSVVDILECHGQCPSVVLDSRDSESCELHSVRDNLAQVSLREHSISVARIMVSLVKETYLDYENHIPSAVITALSHDLGKIPEYRLSGIYNTSEHHLISALKLRELSEGEDISWIEQALKAIKDHHMYSTDQFTNLLKQADRKAREMELLRFARSFTIKPFEEWFEVEGLLKLIEPHINHLQKNKWKAFSFRGVVYCLPDLLYEKTRELLRENKILDLTFIYGFEKENALRRIVGILRQSGYIPDVLPSGRYTRKFEIKSSAGKKRFMLIPLRGDCFNLDEVERRKSGYLSSIRDVRAV